MTSVKKGAAFFDFDGTITFRDSFLEFIKYSVGIPRLSAGILCNLPFICLFYLKMYPNQKLKERFFSFFYKGVSEVELEKQGDSFGKSVIPGLCYKSALDVIAWHKEQGHDIYLITASSKIWLKEWCRVNAIHLIGTEFEVVNGRYTGMIKGKNCYGEEKFNRIQPLLQSYDFSQTYGYGDRASDKFYLTRLNRYFLMPLNRINVTKYWLRLKEG
jgi:phosphatidylglycerophosphatase C